MSSASSRKASWVSVFVLCAGIAGYTDAGAQAPRYRVYVPDIGRQTTTGGSQVPGVRVLDTHASWTWRYFAATDVDGGTYVHGEVENTAPDGALVSASVRFLDASGAEVATRSTDAVPVPGGGGKTCFRVVAPPWRTWSRYEISAPAVLGGAYATAGYAPAQQGYDAVWAWYRTAGRLTNPTGRTAYLGVHVTYYGEGGKVVGCGQTFNGATVGAGGTVENAEVIVPLHSAPLGSPLTHRTHTSAWARLG